LNEFSDRALELEKLVHLAQLKELLIEEINELSIKVMKIIQKE